MKKFIAILLLIAATFSSYACTSVIISGRRTASGMPILFKNRDTRFLDNRLQYFEVGEFRFVGVVNSSMPEGEVWSGSNNFGFSIINTADYNFSEDALHPDAPRKIQMDREGEVMYKALATCRTVADFLHLLDTLPKPLGVETNFGVVDAQGAAMYVECNNWRYVTYDVNALPEGYKVQTNFAFAGDSLQRMGVERYRTASAIMAKQQRRYPQGDLHIDHRWLLQHFSRSYRHEVLGTQEDYCPRSGVCVDQDFIPRRITSNVFYAEGPVLWTLLGYPACGVAFPVVVGPTDLLPDAAKRYTSTAQIPSWAMPAGEANPSNTLSPNSPSASLSPNCLFSDTNMRIKMHYLFPDAVSNGKHYLHLSWVQKGSKNRPSMKQCATRAEGEITALFSTIATPWLAGQLSDEEFYRQYRQIADKFYEIYTKHFSPYLDF